MLSKSGVYTITNTVNGKQYVGSTVQFCRRWNAHKSALRRKDHHSVKLQRAWERYGQDNFVFTPLIVCSIADLHFFEQLFLDAMLPHKVGYNHCQASDIARRGDNSARHNRRISAAHKGKTYSDARRKQISQTLLEKETGIQYTYLGETRTIRGWADKYGLSYNTLQHRIRLRGGIEEALTREATAFSDVARAAHQASREKAAKFEYAGEFKSLTEWSKILGVSKKVLNTAVYKKKKTIAYALEHRQRVMKITYAGETKTVHAWAKEKNLTRNTIVGRLVRGWTVSEALSIPKCKQGSDGRASVRGQLERV